MKLLIAFEISFIKGRKLFTFYLASTFTNAPAAVGIEGINLAVVAQEKDPPELAKKG